MVMDAVQSQQVRGGGVSRAKIVQFIKSKYKLEDVRAVALKRAISKAIENEQLETKTGRVQQFTIFCLDVLVMSGKLI